MDDEIRDDVAPQGEGSEEEIAPQAEEPSVLPLGDTSKLAAIEESLEGEPVEQPDDSVDDLADVGVDEQPDAAVDERAAELSSELEPVVEVPGEAQPAEEGAAAEPVLPPIDLGPERRSNLWVWIGLLVGVLIAAAAIGYVWWYTTSRPVVVPDVVGKLPAQATQTLNDVGLRLGKVSEVPTDTAAAGTVISQSPAALEELKPNAQVSLVLAAPPETTKIPDVSGKSYDDAASTLTAARLTPTRVDSHATTVAAGFVMSQLPTAGAAVQPGAVVAVVVSRGPAPTSYRVPQLTGLPEQDAATLVAPLDIVATSYRSFNNSIAAGIVVTQSPIPGSQVVAGGGIQYLVSGGPGTSPVTIPDVTGDSRKDAETALKAKGLKPQVKGVPSANVAKGVVISQMPPGGSRSATGGVVGLLVSTGNVAQAAVPNIVGKPSEEASKAIAAAGFRPFMIEVAMSGTPAGSVIMQFPAPKTSWPVRLPVVCLVAKAP